LRRFVLRFFANVVSSGYVVVIITAAESAAE